MINSAKDTHGARVISTDSYKQGDASSYLIDYEVNSSTAQGAKTKGSVYIRGVKGDGEYDAFKFILEKGVDFSDLDIKLILKAYEEAYKPKAIDV